MRTGPDSNVDERGATQIASEILFVTHPAIRFLRQFWTTTVTVVSCTATLVSRLVVVPVALIVTR